MSGAAVKMAEDRGVPLSSLSVADLQSIHPLFDDDVVKVGLSHFVLCLCRRVHCVCASNIKHCNRQVERGVYVDEGVFVCVG